MMSRFSTPIVPIMPAGVADDDAAFRIHAAKLAQHGVAVGVLRVHALQRQPAAHVVPAVRRLRHQHFRSVFHHGEVDADFFHRLIFGSQYGLTVRPAPGVGDALDGGV